MTDPELQRRAIKAEQLPVFNIGDGIYYVQSEEGKIAYKVTVNGELFCPCADLLATARTMQTSSASIFWLYSAPMLIICSISKL